MASHTNKADELFLRFTTQGVLVNNNSSPKLLSKLYMEGHSEEAFGCMEQYWFKLDPVNGVWENHIFLLSKGDVEKAGLMFSILTRREIA